MSGWVPPKLEFLMSWATEDLGPGENPSSRHEGCALRAAAIAREPVVGAAALRAHLGFRVGLAIIAQNCLR